MSKRALLTEGCFLSIRSDPDALEMIESEALASIWPHEEVELLTKLLAG